MRCKNCHYALANLTENRCPECGNAFDPNDPETFDTVASVWKLNTASVMIAVCLSTLIAGTIVVLSGHTSTTLLIALLTAIAFSWVFTRVLGLWSVHRMNKD